MKRTRVEILYTILSIINKEESIKPTHLLYKTNLSHAALTKYVEELLSTGFLIEEHIHTRKRHRLTEKGQTFLHEYERFVKFAEAFGLPVF